MILKLRHYQSQVLKNGLLLTCLVAWLDDSPQDRSAPIFYAQFGRGMLLQETYVGYAQFGRRMLLGETHVGYAQFGRIMLLRETRVGYEDRVLSHVEAKLWNLLPINILEDTDLYVL